MGLFNTQGGASPFDSLRSPSAALRAKGLPWTVLFRPFGAYMEALCEMEF